MKHRKEISIHPDHVKPLTMEGIRKGHKNLKVYLESIIDKAGCKAIEDPRNK